jgi:DNA-binding MarR family transcriptional regulator
MSSQKPFYETTSFLHATTCRITRTYGAKLLAEIGLYPGQEMILALLWQEDGLTHSHITEHLGLQPPTVTRMLQRMEGSGLIKRSPDLSDSRVLRVSLTQKGRDIRQPIEDIWQRVEEQMLAGFSVEEKIIFRRLLMQIQQNVKQNT